MKMMKLRFGKIGYILVSVIFLLLASVCHQPSEQDNKNAVSTESTSSFSISVKDDVGSVISLDAPAKRIIALAPHIVENVYSAGAGDLLVAVVDYANFPAQASKLPSVGGYNKFNIETIAALKPDVVFAWQSGTPAHFLEKIKQLGIPLYLDEPSTIHSVANSIINIGKLTGRLNIAEAVAEEHLKQLEKVVTAQQNKSAIKVFYQVWDDPLYTINGKQIISDVLRLCGGKNIFAAEKIKAPIVNLEALLQLNPDVIITGSEYKSADDALGTWKKWQNLSAVKHNNLFVVNPDIVSRHTVRILQGVASVCEKLDQARNNLQNAVSSQNQ